MRKIIHIDMDAFYASVEQRDKPELRGKAVAVGYDSDRGVLTTASYEARKFGVHSAMATKIARRMCPSLIIVPPRFDVYENVSHQIRNIFFEYTDLVEPLSLDEAYLDVTANKKNIHSATLIAKEIKARIRQETGLTASAGISINKFLAKVASDMDKPNGLYLIPPDNAVEFIEKLPIEKFFGIGRVTAKKMHEMGIRNGLDLKKLSEPELINRFGKNGKYFYAIARAEDNREVNPARIMKSIGAENTFAKDLMDYESAKDALDEILDVLFERMERSETIGKTLTVKVKYGDFQQITRSKTIHDWIRTKDQMKALYQELLKGVEFRNGIRLLGLSLSNLNHEMEDSGEDKQDPQLTFGF